MNPLQTTKHAPVARVSTYSPQVALPSSARTSHRQTPSSHPPNQAAPQSPPPQRKHVHVFETAAAAPYNTPAVPAASPTINCLVPTVACSGSTSLESSAEAMAVGAA
ncbi:hypothetical protein PMIN03_001882 [Paraphaeosphaeria minitans]